MNTRKLNRIKIELSNVIENNRLIHDRVRVLRSKGYSVEERPMGSGGVGQVVATKNEIRVQIGCGHGRYNYAYAVIVSKINLK